MSATTDEFTAWTQESWRASSQWQSMTAHFTAVIEQLTRDLRAAEQRERKALFELDCLGEEAWALAEAIETLGDRGNEFTAKVLAEFKERHGG